jgi:Ca2+-binding EF-hand superfamily protein
MRYLGYFPSERDIVEKILPAMKGDDPTEFVLYDRFEDYMLVCMVNEDYLPASDSGLLAAFRVLDEEKKGYIDVGRLSDLLTKKGIPFRPKELTEFLTKAADSIHQNRVYYEDYVTMFSKSVDVILLESSNIQPPATAE